MRTEHIHIDGGMGEGGGQVLRSALALSAGLGKPFSIVGIRRSRRKPGLRKQHLCAVNAVAALCRAKCSGVRIDSDCLSFEPGPVQPGEYLFDIRGAGSCTLVLQAVLPPLLVASGPSRVTVRGATHTANAPTYEFFAETLLPILARLGPRLKVRLDRHGFGAGGGSMTVEILPAPEPQRLEWEIDHPATSVPWRFRILAANLPDGLAEYEAERIVASLWGGFFPGDTEGLRQHAREYLHGGWPRIEHVADADGPGNVIVWHGVQATGTRVLSAHGGTSRTSARKAAEEICARLAYYREYWGNADRYLADQLIVPLSLARGGFFFCQTPTLHTRTCCAVTRLFTGKSVGAEQLHDMPHWKIEVPGAA
ncbi:RNA 3'-terminal phosphate cyclase [Desulfobulbus sp.]|uniref:RNA 3'-terminal phosphate cyclase n=1 Tax=Desulfobulbus sp. TaxID=895 RepID=UPI00286ED5E3|nr:RNA 3'-terminal phosphate cyclase [Desulfobulbus sp.]